MTAYIKINGNLIPINIYARIGTLLYGSIDNIIGLYELSIKIEKEFVFDDNGKPLDMETIEKLLNS